MKNTSLFRGHKHLVNVTNSTYSCFLNCLAWHYLKKKDAGKYSEEFKKFINGLNLKKTGINVQETINLQQIKKLLAQNKKYLGNLQINILGFKSNQVYVYETNIGSRNDNNCLNLLSIPLVNLNDGKSTEDHLVAISSLDDFLEDRYPGKSGQMCVTRRKYCLGCLNGFSTEEILKKHR